MAERISALHGHYARGKIGAAVAAAGEAGVVLCEVRDLILHQISAWPGTLDEVAKEAARGARVPSAPGPGAAESVADGAALLRVEPLKWWLIGGQVPEIPPEHGATLDLSHARTHLRISGGQAAKLLNRHLPLDLREASFPAGAVASSALHHVGVTVWRSRRGYELFVPRGVALSVWEVLLETAEQFGAEIL